MQRSNAPSRIPWLCSVLAAGAIGWIGGRRGAEKPSGTVDPGSQQAQAVFPPTPDPPVIERLKSSGQGGSAPEGPPMRSESECLEAATTLGRGIYTRDAGHLEDSIRRALKTLPEHLHQVFWNKFCEAAAQAGSSADHIRRVQSLAEPLRTLFKSTKTRRGGSVYDQMLTDMAVEGLNYRFNEYGDTVRNLPAGTAEEARYKRDWEKMALQAGLLRNPVDGLDLIETFDPDMRRELGAALVRRLALSDKRRALDYFLSERYAGDSGSQVAAAVLQTYAAVDPETVSARIRDAAPSPQRDSASAYLANMIAVSDPEAANIWAESIADPVLRANTRRDVELRVKEGNVHVPDTAPVGGK